MDNFEFPSSENNNQGSEPQFQTEQSNDQNFIWMNKENNKFIEFDNPLSNEMNLMNTNILNEEEQKRIEEREAEQIKRRKKIEEKIQFELKKKEEVKEKAIQFLNEFMNKR